MHILIRGIPVTSATPKHRLEFSVCVILTLFKTFISEDITVRVHKACRFPKCMSYVYLLHDFEVFPIGEKGFVLSDSAKRFKDRIYIKSSKMIIMD